MHKFSYPSNPFRPSHPSRSGSTLILALLLITVVSVMAFGTGQLYVSEIRIVNTLEGATGAQYAAESAIEEGIHAFRANRGFQRCEAQGLNAQDQDCTTSDANRKGRDETIGLATVNWKASYLADIVGDSSGNGQIQLNDFPADVNQAQVKIKNNESRLFDVIRVVKKADGSSLNGDIDLYFKYYNCTGQGATDNDKCVNVKYGRSGNEGPGGPVIEIRLISASLGQPVLVQLVDGVLCEEGGGSCTVFTTRSFNRTYKIRLLNTGIGYISSNVFAIDDLIDNIINTAGTGIDKTEIRALEIKSFGADIAIGLVPKPSNSALIDTSITTIEALGSMGDAKRKLVAEIDRKHGTLMGVNGYTLYGEGGLGIRPVPK